MTVDSTPSIIEVRNELGLSGTCSLLTDIGDASVNDCSGGGDLSTPISLLAWAGYNHAAPPGIPSGFSGNPGNDGSPSEDPQQDSWVYMSWGNIVCSDTYEVYAASGSGGSFILLATTTSDEFYADFLTTAQESRYYKIRAVAGVGSPSPTYGSYTSEVHLKTTPQAPLSVNALDNDNCSSFVITVSWSNGVSPGIRSSITNWRQRKNGGTWSSYTSTALGATSFTYPAAGSISVNDSDTHDFELYYADRTGAAKASVTNTASCEGFD